MDFSDTSIDLPTLVASIADICMKPWKHAVVCDKSNFIGTSKFDQPNELIMRIECRSLEGERHPENDLELEIFRSGDHLNLVLGWCNQLDKPMLWQGQHSVWMDGNNGKRCQSPMDAAGLESLARRLRTLFDQSESI